MIETKTVGILGSGDVGRALGRGLAAHGFSVMLGSREPQSERLKAWLAETEGEVATGLPAEAVAHGQLVILAVKGSAVEAVLDDLDAAAFEGKLVLDATNPLTGGDEGPPGLFVGTTDSLGERVQARLPGARVVKCFNTVPNPQMVDPSFEQGAPPMLICGQDPEAKKATEALLIDLGWPGVLDVGGIEAARWLEALVPLWVRVGQAMGTWQHAFRPVT